MSFLKSLGQVGSAALATTGPLGVAAAAAINAYLSEDERVLPSDTIDDVEAKLNSLPEDKRAEVMAAYYNYLGRKVESDNSVTINQSGDLTEQLRIMEETDRRIKVRPDIANRMAWLVIAASIIVIIVHCLDVFLNDGAFDVYLIGTLMALPTWVIKKYFDRRTEDKAIKANLLSNQKIEVPKGLGAKIINKIIN